MDKFQFYKYFSNKFVLPLVAMVLWFVLVYTNKVSDINGMITTGAGLLMFSGLFSAHDALLAYLKAKGVDDSE